MGFMGNFEWEGVVIGFLFFMLGFLLIQINDLKVYELY